MVQPARFRPIAAIAALCSMAVLLSACLLTPGAFQSRLELNSDESFTFTYRGEIYMMALSKIADMANKADDEEDASSDTEEGAKSMGGNDEEAMKALMGGLDPSSPETAEELAMRLRRQEGWNSVEYLGDGLFSVDFAISGTLSHDFAFPTIEQFPMPNFFVMATKRSNGSVRIDAPGFAPQSSANPMQGMMSGMMAAAAASGTEDGEESDNAAAEDVPYVPELRGTFTIVTDGEVLANNTDEGMVIEGSQRIMEWEISPRTQAAPMALIQLGS